MGTAAFEQRTTLRRQRDELFPRRSFRAPFSAGDDRADPQCAVNCMKIPGSTYRLQFNKQFRFPDAVAIIDYLSELGVTDVYSSPIFTAPPESNHGYDVANYNELNPVLG